jgi:hypothetical protein
VVLQSRQLCLEPCTHGDGDESKCHGRREMACTKDVYTIDAYAADVCMPTCNDDDECNGARVCDRRLALCATEQSGGDGPAQAFCGDGGTECRGECDDVVTVSICLERCVLGAVVSCRQPANSDVEARCLNPTPRAGSHGDLATCARQCEPGADDCVTLSRYPRCNALVDGQCYCGDPTLFGLDDCAP